MRPIKFRLWDKTTGQMYDKPDIHTAPRMGYPIMQYTGLKDKNGREVYEGDVIRLPKYTKHFIGVVEYSDYYGGYKPFVEMHNSLWSDSEIVGNIHENPELLDQ